MPYYKPLSPGEINADQVTLKAGKTAIEPGETQFDYHLCVDGLNAFGLPEIGDIAEQAWRRSYTLFLGQRPWENEATMKGGIPSPDVHQATSLRSAGSVRLIDGKDGGKTVNIRHHSPVTPTVFQEQVEALVLQMLRTEFGSVDVQLFDPKRRPDFDAQVMLADWLTIDAVNDSVRETLGAHSKEYRLAVSDLEGQQKRIAREHRSLRPDVPVETILSNAKVLRVLAEQIQSYLQAHPECRKKTTVVKRLDDKDGIYLFEVEVQSETPGEKIEFCFQKRGIFGKNQQLKTHIACTEWLDGMPVGGGVLSDFDEEAGEWGLESK